VYPLIRKRFEDPAIESEFVPVIAIKYNSKPLAVLRFTEYGNFEAFINGVVFRPKNAWMVTQPVVFLSEGLGFKISNVHAVELDFVPEVLDEFIKDILSSNREVARWVVFKYRLYIGE